MDKKKILVIDDEQDFGKMVKLNLEDTGQYTVRIEDKGANAISVTKEFKPDLILLDIVMPDVDGGEVVHQMKKEEELKDIPVVFLTAIVTEGEVDSQRGVIAGYPFIAKPVSVKKLISSIEENLTK